AQLLEHLAEALHPLAVLALEALAHQPLECPAGILAVDQPIGELVEQLVRVDRKSLGAVPAVILKAGHCHGGTSTSPSRRFYRAARSPNPLVRPGPVEDWTHRTIEQRQRALDLLGGQAEPARPQVERREAELRPQPQHFVGDALRRADREPQRLDLLARRL